MTDSLDHARKARISVIEFMKRSKDPHYEWWKAELGRALLALEAEAKQPKRDPYPPLNTIPKPIPSDAYLNVVRNLLVWATVTDDAVQQACRLGPEWKFLCTADPAYHVSDAQINAARASGHGVYGWSDCHTIGPNEGKAFVTARGLDGYYGEGESPAAFDLAAAAKSIGVIANLSALRLDQITHIAFASVLVTAELYRNVQPAMQPDWRNANKGIGGNCGAVYESSSEGAVYTPVTAYGGACNSWYVEGFREADWKALLP